MEYETDGEIICTRRAQYSQQRIGTGSGGLENKGTTEKHPN